MIENFNKYISSVPITYNLLKSQLKNYDMETQDILHELELNTLTRDEKSKLATKLQKTRRFRRKCKDEIELLEPVIDLLEKDYSKSFKNHLGQVLGQIRIIQKKQQTRTYRKRTNNGDQTK